MSKKITVTNEFFEPYEFWKNFIEHTRIQLEIEKGIIHNNFDHSVELFRQVDRELMVYNAEFVFLEMSVVFQNEQDATQFLLMWSS